LASINTNKNAINTILEGIASVLEDRVTYLDGSAVNILTLSIQDFWLYIFLSILFHIQLVDIVRKLNVRIQL